MLARPDGGMRAYTILDGMPTTIFNSVRRFEIGPDSNQTPSELGAEQ